MYKNNSTRFGQIGIEADKEVFLELIKNWDREEADRLDLPLLPDGEIEEEFKNAIRDGEIIEL